MSTFSPVEPGIEPRFATTPPALVPGWYMVCASRELRRGEIRRFDLGDESLVVFRGEHGVQALPAHCLHQGVDLTHGEVVGDCVRCPLHHWMYSEQGVHVPGCAPRSLRSRHRASERFGMVFVFAGETPYPIPRFTIDDDALFFRAGKPVAIHCPWYVPVANAFDMTHLSTVHRRELRRAPDIGYPDPVTFTCDYATAVIGDGWSDRMMRALSRNDIRVNVTCSGGTIIMVESHIGAHRGYLMVSLRPTRDGVSILPIFGVPRTKSHLHRLYARVSAALFTAFLRRDVEALGGIRFPAGFLDNRDETINACYRFLCQLPEYRSEEKS
jgi:nitrite reductase/ring-hydroxylating ferredoxin subunit